MTASTQTQVRWRLGSDTNSVDTAATWIAAENTSAAIDVSGGPAGLRVRLSIQVATNNTPNAVWNLRECNTAATGTYQNINATSTKVQSFDASSSADGTAVTSAQLTAGTGSYVSGLYSETGNTTSAAFTTPNYTELEYGIEVDALTVVNGESLFLRVHRAGTALTTYTNTGLVTVTKVVAGAPTALGATTMSASEIDLAWTAPASGTTTGYKIERETPVGGGFGVLVANTATTAVAYNDTSCAAGTQYNYRVSAVNFAGAGTASGTAANTTTAALDVGVITGTMMGPPYF